jgi:parallel beta-helix repeat protein
MNKIILSFGIIFLLYCITFSPLTIGKVIEKTYLTSYNGKTLYVGGTGENNYTSIQDAIDDASDSDTIFVYSYSSPYYECITIPKRITLTGEDKYRTVIDGEGSLNTITVEDGNVRISNFTIQNQNKPKYYPYYGIYIKNNYDHITISDNIISNIETGISIGSNYNQIINNNFINCGIYISPYSCYNTIFDNNVNNRPLFYLEDQSSKEINNAGQVILIDCQNITIINSNISNVHYGILLLNTNNCDINQNILNNSNIFLLESCKNEVENNKISQIKARTMYQEIGIRLLSSNENTISRNQIYSNHGNGFLISHSNRNNIFANEIKDNFKGIALYDSNSNIIKNNNFKGNNENVDFLDSNYNNWNSNYWGRSRILPKIISGSITIRPPGFGTPGLYFPWFNFDWHPAKKPYDINTNDDRYN